MRLDLLAAALLLAAILASHGFTAAAQDLQVAQLPEAARAAGGKSLGRTEAREFFIRPQSHGGAAERLLARKWQHMASRVSAPVGSAVKAWGAYLDRVKKLPLLEQLAAVDAYANRVPFREDRINWRERDYWATPAEFFTHGGDCEDYAIAKYASLRILGVPAENLALLVVRDAKRARAPAHAVLLVEVEGSIWMLDSLSPAPRLWEGQTRYKPLYAVSELGARLVSGNMTL